MKPLPLLFLAGLLVLSACSSTTVRQEECPPIVGLRNPSVHFVVDNTRKLPASGTFDWGIAVYRIGDVPGVNLSKADQLIHESLAKALTQKGFAKTESAPELLVSYALTSGAGLDEKTLNEAYEGAVEAPPTVSADSQHPLQYRRGALIVDIVQARTKRLLWRGAIMADVDLTLNEAQKRARCEGAVGELLKHYPKP